MWQTSFHVGQGFCMVNLVASAFSIFKSHTSDCEKKGIYLRRDGWTAVLRKVVAGGSMRRFQECILRSNRNDISSSTRDIWLLGVCYKVLQDDSSEDSATNSGLAAFEQDFSSRILITYRKGYKNAILYFFLLDPGYLTFRFIKTSIYFISRFQCDRRLKVY